MKILPPVLIAGIVGLILCACPQLGPTGLSGLAPATTSACTGAALNKVQFLQYGFDPKSNTTPQPDAATIPDDVWADLQKAFSIAPPGFQQQLCNLNGIFINPASCARLNPNDPTSPYDPKTCNPSPMAIGNNSWGMRQYDQNSGAILGEYIALSLGLWNNSASPGWTCIGRTYCAPPFQTYQTGVVQALLMSLAPAVPINATNLPTISSSASANTSEMSVLATVAHEYGHVLWYDKFVPRGGGPADPTGAGFCGGKFYTGPLASWKYPVAVPPGRWLDFGEIREQSPLNSTILNLPGFYTANQPGLAGDNLNRLFNGGLWASTLAAFSPDEDLVETFELTVLAAAKPPGAAQPLLQSMVMKIPGSRGRIYSFDIFDNLVSGTELARKYVCVAGSLPPQAQFRHRP